MIVLSSLVPGGFSVQDLNFFISYVSWFSDLKFSISDLDQNLKISDLKVRSEMENFRSEITLKNKISDLKSDLRNPLLNYDLSISSKIWSFYFLMFLQYTIMFRLTSGQKKFRIFPQIVFFN